MTDLNGTNGCGEPRGGPGRGVRGSHRRRGGGIAAVVIMMAAINFAVIGAIRASGDEAQVGAMRAETARAFYLAESGGRVVLKCTTAGATLPTAGSSLTLGTATCTYV